MQQITEKELRRQVPIYYFVMIAWPVYVLMLPVVYSRLGWISILFMVFPGAYLYVWMGLLMHECWHKYVPGIKHSFFYNLYSFMLVTDPQIYKLVHGHHHSKVNTWQDTEFHPFGKIKKPLLRRLHNFAEITTGVIWMVPALMQVLPKHEKYSCKYRPAMHNISIAAWIIIYGSLAALSIKLFNVTVMQVIVPYAVNTWLCSLFLHHVQLIEHGNVIIEGDFDRRKLNCRNLRRNGILENIFHFITHSDARQHVLHHTFVKIHNRPFPYRMPSPDDTVFISMTQYMGILFQMATKG